MNLALCSLASGSSGNCYLIKSNKVNILADAGISGRQIALRLEALGVSPSELSGVLVTHEHSDHTKGLSVIAKTKGVRIYINEGTYKNAGLTINDENLHHFSTGDVFEIEDIQVKSFHLSHDAADPVGYSFKSGDKKISIVTDTGVVTEEIYDCIKDSDILVLESNHDVSMLRIGPYPWFLKQRILSDKGHLSNDAAAEVIRRIACEEREINKKMRILLAHMSKENNFPEMALATVNNTLEAEGLTPGKEFSVETLLRDKMSPLYVI